MTLVTKFVIPGIYSNCSYNHFQTQLEKLKTKYDLVEGERDVLAENETKLEKVRQLTSQLEVERLATANAIEQLEQEQCDKRELQEQLNDIKVRENNY